MSDREAAREKWEEHNESFQYEPPERPPDAWSSEEYTELYDRTIRREVKWVCQKCSKPLSSLKRARRHVRSQHGDRLLEQAKARQEQDN